MFSAELDMCKQLYNEHMRQVSGGMKSGTRTASYCGSGYQVELHWLNLKVRYGTNVVKLLFNWFPMDVNNLL